MKPDPRQEALLQQLMEKHHEIMTERRFGMLEAKRALEAKLEGMRREESRLANRALEAGLSKTRIGRAVGTSNWHTVAELLDLTGDERKAEQEIADKLPRFEIKSPRKGEFMLSVYSDDNGKLFSPPRSVRSARHQGSNWGDPSYVYFTYSELGIENADTLDEIEAQLVSAVRLQGGMEEVRIQGRPTGLRSVTVPTTTSDNSGFELGSPEWLKWLDEQDD